jgi:hypothetical protein
MGERATLRWVLCVLGMTYIYVLPSQMRLRSTIIGVVFLPPTILAFGWICEKRVHAAAICVFLFLAGLFAV